MTATVPRLTGPSHPPASGAAPRKLVILLHGVGADGQDLIGLAPPLSGVLPDAEFLAPDGPEPCDMAPFGRQWFSLQDRTPSRMLGGLQATAPILDAFIDEALAERGLTDADLALVGFSQGTMMALHVAPRRPRACAGVLGFSGALLGPELLPAEARSKPPVMLIHGDADPVVPFGALAAAGTALDGAGFTVEAETRPGLGHGIDPEGLTAGARFLVQCLAG